MTDDEPGEIRSFNRFYTATIGVLDEHIVQSSFTLAEARLVYEIGARGRVTAAQLSRSLGLDPGYLHRLRLRLIEQGLVAITPTDRDRRASNLALTAEGDAAFAQLDAGSASAVETMIEHLDPADRATLVKSMQAIRRLLGDPSLAAAPLVLRPHRIGELGWLIHRQGLLYHQQHGWNAEFEALIAGLYRDYELAPPVPSKSLWVAERAGEIVGSVFCMPSEGLRGSAQLRMLYVEPAARGAGLGSLLVDQCVGFARNAGYDRIRLWTQSVLISARRIYEAAGFEMVSSKPHRSFGRDLVGETWELRF